MHIAPRAILFSENRARESEGILYAAEKRCHRRGLRGWRNLLPLVLSWLYDKSAEYGHSYGRALAAFLIFQFVAVFGYAALSDRLHLLYGAYDGRVFAFTVAQLLKPFELYAPEQPDPSAAFQIVPNPPDGWWLALTTMHSLVSFALLALFLLALRWRFRRD